jgi:hypothetical protein
VGNVSGVSPLIVVGFGRWLLRGQWTAKNDLGGIRVCSSARRCSGGSSSRPARPDALRRRSTRTSCWASAFPAAFVGQLLLHIASRRSLPPLWLKLGRAISSPMVRGRPAVHRAGLCGRDQGGLWRRAARRSARCGW